MFEMIPSMQAHLQCLAPALTEPSFQTQTQVFLGWVMCLGRHTEFNVFQTIFADQALDRNERHGFDRFYNFFSRSAWKVSDLVYHIALMAVSRLVPEGLLCLIVDDTLLHKRGKKVYGLGWFRDAVASTKTRVATASGNHWVVMGLGVRVPKTEVILCLPLGSRLHQSGQGSSEAALAQEMLKEVIGWFPARQFVLVADGAYACDPLLKQWDDWTNSQVEFVGVIRSDAAIYDPTPLPQPKSKRGPKPQKGPRKPSPKEVARKADRARSPNSPWAWQSVSVCVSGVTRTLLAVSYEVVWPKVLGLKPILVVVVRDPEGQLKDTYLFTTKRDATLEWVIGYYSWRWSIEVAFKASKQVLNIQGPRHWCQESIQKLAPWVWLMQTLISVWYLTAGRDTEEAQDECQRMGEWDSEWSMRHMLRVLRLCTMQKTINANSASQADLQELTQQLKNYLSLAA